METTCTFNFNSNSKVKYIFNTSDNQEIEYTEKDLKVLQILKKLFTLECDTIPNKIIISGTITPEEFDKIKEWITNDR